MRGVCHLGAAWASSMARRICQLIVEQQEFFSGHKRFHVVKYQAVMSAIGIIRQLDGPFKRR